MTITDDQGLFYQNDMESQHAKEKRMHCFKTDNVMQAVGTIETMIQKQEDEERAALYGSLHHVLAPAYKRFYSQAWEPGISGTFLSPGKACCSLTSVCKAWRTPSLSLLMLDGNPVLSREYEKTMLNHN